MPQADDEGQPCDPGCQKQQRDGKPDPAGPNLVAGCRRGLWEAVELGVAGREPVAIACWRLLGFS